ncbi:MAG: hypothetical protein K6G61_05805 [Solobacterium sp.]|nr:hypothetical protein [Solobacterium sp.]
MNHIRRILLVLLAAFAVYIFLFRNKTEELLVKEAQLRTENAALAESLGRAEEKEESIQNELRERTEAVQPYLEEYEVWKKRTDGLSEILQH